MHAGLSSTISSSFATPFTLAVGITLDESSNLWSADLNATKIYGHAGISATISTSFASPDAFVWGLSIDSVGGC